MPTPPQSWELATPVFGIRYPKPTAPAKYLPDMFTHTGLDVESALLADGNVPPGLNYKTGTNAQRLVAPPVQDQIWVETDTGNKYIGTGTAWIPLASTSGELYKDYKVAALYNGATGTPIAFAGPRSGVGPVTANGAYTVFTLGAIGLWRIDVKIVTGHLTGQTAQFQVMINGVLDARSSVYVGGNAAGAATMWGPLFQVTTNTTTTISAVVTSATAFQIYDFSWFRLTYLGAERT